jgi:DNA polymerase (family X)
LELAGGNPYRAPAYARAAGNLLLSPLPLQQLIAEDRLTEIPGIGDALAVAILLRRRAGSVLRTGDGKVPDVPLVP